MAYFSAVLIYVCSPYIIGTMGQATSSATLATASNLLQLHHNFRWILYSNHAEPVSGFLQRYLRRRLIAVGTGRCAQARQSAAAMSGGHGPAGPDLDDGDGDGGMAHVVDWLPRAWQHANRFLESQCATTDVTIGILLQLYWNTHLIAAVFFNLIGQSNTFNRFFTDII